MEKEYFSLAEANAQVPRLAAAFERVMRLRTQLKQQYRQLELVGFAPAGEEPEPEVPGAPPEVVRERAVFRGLAQVLRGELNEILEMGCLIKDVETGLVDWFSRRGGRDIFLCWRFGEKQIEFWHDLESGFAGRRPIAELEALEEPDEPDEDPRTLH